MNKKVVIILAIILVLAIIAGVAFALNAGPTGQTRQLDAQLALWQAQGLTDYEMKLGIGCFCPFYDRMPLTVTVRGGKVESVVDSQGQPVAADDPIRMYGNEQLMTIEGVFAYTREALGTADEVTIKYDPALGYPSLVSVDRIKLAMDDEMSVTVSDVLVLPKKLIDPDATQ